MTGLGTRKSWVLFLLVFPKLVLSLISFSALKVLTLPWSQIGVCLLVFLKVTLVPETLLTNIALKVPCVPLHVVPLKSVSENNES
jgi:hypothetical protein